MNRILYTFLIPFLYIVFMYSSTSSDNQDKIACGPYVTQKLLIHYSKEHDLTSIINSFGNLEQAVSLLDIKRILRQMDLPAEAARLEGIDLLPHWTPCIAHLKDNHFTVIVDAGQEEMLLDDDREGLRTVSTQRFLEEWDGVILSPRLTGPEAIKTTPPLIHHPLSLRTCLQG